jgi:hypothetical protein
MERVRPEMSDQVATGYTRPAKTRAGGDLAWPRLWA